MRRRRQHEEHENLERWLVSYADFITLLFAFFVVMYAVSSVNEGKYRVLSETLSAVFAETPRSSDPIQIGEPPRDVLALPDGPLAEQQDNLDSGGATVSSTTADTAADNTEAKTQPPAAPADGATQRVADEILISMQDYVAQGLVKVTQGKGRVEIEMQDRMLFGSGDARLSSEALRALRVVAQTLQRVPSHIQVEGHTDDIPISTAAFPSNWELSAARAASVVHFLSRAGIEPWRMAAVGLGEHRPIAENKDERGRAANRRVTIVLLTGKREQISVMDDEVPWAEGPALEVK
ncbi:MAG: flagellar motor protein MotD [Gammaproteobacteria bacterium]|nr:flagellar motor protein MotD [Gammaproteobacteria bacterium]MCB1922920.1 flagellar motor protein MotD [Gammaproteobacteria bacterium]